MDSAGKTYRANAYHPDLGNEVAAGEISVSQWTVHFRSPDITVDLPIDQLSVTLSESDTERIVLKHQSKPGWIVYTYDFDLFDDRYLAARTAIRAQIRNIYAHEHNWRKLLWVTLGAFAVFMFIAFLLFQAGGWTVNYLVSKVPTKYEIEIGNEMIQELKADFDLEENTKQTRALEALAKRFIPAEEQQRFKFNFYLLDTDTPNAMAAPGGNIVVTTGLLALCDTPEELAFVIAHEVAHVTERHGVKQIISEVGPYVLLKVFLQNSGAFLSAVGSGSSILVSQNFSQTFENQADEVGWKMLTAANINPHGSITSMKKLQQIGEEPTGRVARSLSSHPPTSERIKRLEARWRKQQRKSGFVTLHEPDLVKPNNLVK